MLTYADAKTMARALRKALGERHIEISHSDSLEAVAREFGLADWNTLAVRLAGTAETSPALPEGWTRAGDTSASIHRMGLDASRPGTIRIECLTTAAIAALHFGTLMQSISAADYRGEKLRLGAELRGEEVDIGTIWMRVDGAGGGQSLRFDNMLSRGGGLSGSFDWTRRDVVLDVPDDAESIHYGAMLKGAGRLWARRFRLEPAEADAATTGTRSYPRGPRNLDFGASA